MPKAPRVGVRTGVVALIGGALASGCGSTQRADVASATGHPPLQLVVRPVLGARIHVPAGAVDVVASDGAVWVAGFGAVSRLDPATGRIVARIRTPHTGDYSQIAVGKRSVWVTADGGIVYRLDSMTNRVVATVHVGRPLQGIAVGAGRVWVTRALQGRGDLIRIDPRTNLVVGAPIKVGPGPGQVTYGRGAVWVQNTSPRSVMRVDPRTGRVTTVVGVVPVSYASFEVGAIAVRYGSLWSAVNDTLFRVEPSSSQVVARVHIPRAQEIAIGHGKVWILAAPRSRSPTLFKPITHTAALWEVDPKSNRIIGEPIRLDGGIAVTANQRNVWIAHYLGRTITRLRLVARARRMQQSGHSRSTTTTRPNPPAQTTTTRSYPRSYRPLLDILGVLRRPQTKADLPPAVLAQARAWSRSPTLGILGGTPVISLIRFATVTRWGQKVFLIPTRPLTRKEIAKLPARDRARPRAKNRVFPGLRLSAPASGGATPAQIKAGLDWGTERSNQLAIVIPDGVAKVKLSPLRTPGDKHPLSVTATVHNNIAAFETRLSPEGPLREIWYGPSGKVMKRINTSRCRPALEGCT